MTNDEDVIRQLAGEGGVAGATDLDAAERAEIDAFRALLADSSTWDEPPPDLGDRVVAAVASERGPAPRALATVPVPPPPVPASRRAHGAAGRRSVVTFLAGAAAAAAVVAGLVVVRNQGGDGGVRVALAPSELVPGATGSARVTRHESGLRIELQATGLPRRDGKLFYQAWLKGDTGLVPIGTFHTGDHVVLWAGVALEDFPTITVTEEEVGDQSSSGRRVLVGTVSG